MSGCATCPSELGGLTHFARAGKSFALCSNCKAVVIHDWAQALTARELERDAARNDLRVAHSMRRTAAREATRRIRELEGALAAAIERGDRLERAVSWALGEDAPGTPDFAAEHSAELDRRDRGERRRGFWWRSTLRALATGTPPIRATGSTNDGRGGNAGKRGGESEKPKRRRRK